jgi:malate synthase
MAPCLNRQPHVRPSFSPAFGCTPPHAGLADGVAPASDVVTPEALSLLADLARAHGTSRQVLLDERVRRRQLIAQGDIPSLSPNTADIRDAEWSIGAIPRDLTDRRVEITGPANPKLMVSALNSGASVFMADLEDSLSPTWDNIVGGHRALAAAAARTLTFEVESGQVKRLNDHTATLTVRPRGLHLPESRVLVDGAEVSASLFDVALLSLRLARTLMEAGSGLYLYLPKMENHHEAQWWDAVLADAERRCALPPNSIRVTVLIEHVLAAFEMDEILFSLRDRVTGLNAGRWDYLFSLVRDFGADESHVLPDRAAVTMRAAFLTAYSERLVSTCHRRGAYAIGGMSAFIPDRSSPETTDRAIGEVQAEKQREADLGYDGAWVAHPDLIQSVKQVFDAVLGEHSNQLRIVAPIGHASDLIDTRIEGAHTTPEGFANNVRVALLYLVEWLGGNGAVAIDNMMEDAATAEIARCQIWQWVHHGTELRDGSTATAEMATRLLEIQMEHAVIGGATPELVKVAGDVLNHAMLDDELPPFLTLLALPHLT